eukprot:TRINITY_DN277_c0_g1_i3.p1 TRINITY_DN277_c0_g1~~TRINITY_DN277_c0_g1_i3.p1  ORF type:complete len:258 (+),score=67.82 TRINITY_DN277_c0_g1_i3:58-831(+)
MQQQQQQAFNDDDDAELADDLVDDDDDGQLAPDEEANIWLDIYSGQLELIPDSIVLRDDKLALLPSSQLRTPLAASSAAASDATSTPDVDRAADAGSRRPASRRYFEESDSSIKCYNCQGEGHMAFQCIEEKRDKVPRCFLCGLSGHNKAECPREICYNCLEAGHQSRQCRNPRDSSLDLCFRCRQRGHQARACPVAVVPPYRPAASRFARVSCYNCGLAGHTGLECTAKRVDQFDRFASSGPPSNRTPLGSGGKRR